MITQPGLVRPSVSSRTASPDCEVVLDALFAIWPEAPGDDLSPAFLQHLCHCRDCLRQWVALEAAADLAIVNFPIAIDLDESDMDAVTVV